MDEKQAEVIRRIYDMVLQPEFNDEFIAHWEMYISELAEPHHDRRNSQGASEVLLQDPLLEEHFARAYSIMSKINGLEAEHSQGATKSVGNFLCQISTDGKILKLGPDSNTILGKLKHASDIATHLDVDNAQRWELYIKRFIQSPAPAGMEVFSLANGGNIVVRKERDKTTGSVALIVNTLSIGWSSDLVELLQESFKLSSKEVQLLRSVSADGNLSATTSQETRSKHTLRSQMKSIFAKMNVNSQAQLMQMTATLAHICGEFDGYDIEQNDEINERLNLQLADGRNMPVQFFGSDTGEPIFFIHGMMDGVGLPRNVVDLLKQKNMRFISPIRPSFGNADGHGNIQEAPSIFASQIEELADYLELETFSMLGHMSGSLYAFATANRMPDRVKAIINVSGGVPTLSAKQFAVMSPRQKAFAYTARFAPQFLPILMRAGVAQVDSNRADKLVESMYIDGSVDREKIDSDKTVKDFIISGYRFAVSQGYKGFEADAFHVTRDWNDLISRAFKNVLLIHGKHDPVVGMQFVEEFAARNGYNLAPFENEGQLLLYCNPKDVLDQITGYLEGLA